MIVVRGYIFPKRGENDESLYVEELDEEYQEKNYEALIGILSEIVSDFSTFYLEGSKKFSTAEELNTLLDAMIFYLRSLLYLDVIPGIIESPNFGVYHHILFSNTHEIGKSIITWDALNQHLDYINKMLLKNKKLLDARKEHQKVIYDVLRFPADTRPGANTSSLLAHILTTSAVATSLFLEKKKDLNEKEKLLKLTILRYASFFHDIGKIKDWHRHVKVSQDTLLQLLERFVEKGSEADKIIRTAVKLIPHRENYPEDLEDYKEIGKIVENADKKASALDRLSKFLLGVIDNELKQELMACVEGYIKDKHFEAIPNERTYYELSMKWDFWDNYVGIPLIKRLTENFCRKISKISPENPVFSVIKEKDDLDSKKSVKIMRIDIRSIQQYVKSNDIRSMNGGSRAIDLLTYVIIPLFLVEELKIPAENILYYGGGNITILVPSSAEMKIKGEINKKIAKEFGITLTFGTADFSTDFVRMTRKLDESLAIEKIVTFSGTADINIFRPCDLCGVRDATEKIAEKKLYVCSLCKHKYDIGNKYHFRRRIDYLIEEENILKELESLEKDYYNEFNKRVLEFIAGEHPAVILQKCFKEYHNLAFVRFDGNLMSQIMASCVSLTDAFERSIRVDYSVKKPFAEFLKHLKNKCKFEYARVVLGLMYLGGDDGAVLMPSRIAIPFALYLANEFHLEMGRKATLSFGIAVAKPKHPIFPLYEGAGYLLDEVVKKVQRSKVYEHIHMKDATLNNIYHGGIAFLSSDTGILSEETIDETLKKIYDEHLSLQYKYGYEIGSLSKTNTQSLDSLLEIIFGKRIIPTKEDTLYELLTVLLPRNCNDSIEMKPSVCETLHKRDESEITELLKQYLHDVLDLLQVSVVSESTLEVKTLYTIKRHETETKENTQDEEQEAPYRVIAKALSNLITFDDSGVYLRLHDLVYLIKILGGGVRGV